MGTMLVLVLTTGVTFLATFSPPGSVAATAEGQLNPSSSPLPPGIASPPVGTEGEAVTTLSSASDGKPNPHRSIFNGSLPLPLHGDMVDTPDAEASIATLSSSASVATGVASREHAVENMDEIDSSSDGFSTGVPKRKLACFTILSC